MTDPLTEAGYAIAYAEEKLRAETLALEVLRLQNETRTLHAVLVCLVLRDGRVQVEQQELTKIIGESYTLSSRQSGSRFVLEAERLPRDAPKPRAAILDVPARAH